MKRKLLAALSVGSVWFSSGVTTIQAAGLQLSGEGELG